MMIETLQILFKRDLLKLKTEIKSYQSEENIWKISQHISNSAGNLCLHLIGNLNHFIGAITGKTGYIRNRESEFSLKDVPRTQLTEMIDNTILVIENTLNNLDEDDLKKEYPLVVFEDKMSTEFFFIHLTAHLSYHLGQINYHRRLLE
ncbi:putative damage-inducible protein DinB [Elizabethkingia anophelis]|nr:putative damage-inducible protein DinB [Elizabethkingia anophelis]MCW2466010.1 putative damage-inducible protein DinB [Elizabethkingia anophelis]MCW2469695.1 putative damage-inducible protein DinB [Elizabethkingia anophelis]